MSDMRHRTAGNGSQTRHKAARRAHARRSHREVLAAFGLASVLVALAVALALRQNGRAQTVEVQVLDCPVVDGVAHHHDESCYDADGNLVCQLPERDLHAHDDSCYEESYELACGTEEGEGAHWHGPECYDDEGNLACGLDESEGHVHTDACYQVTRTLACGQEELTEEHVHGQGCFRTETVSAEMPAQAFEHVFKDAGQHEVLRVCVDAPEGALPEGSTMEAEWVDTTERKNTEVQGAIEDAVAKRTDGRIAEVHAVDITFKDAGGREVEPAKKVTVTMTSPQIADSRADDKADALLVHVESEREAAERAERQGKDEYQVEGQVVKPLTDRQLRRRDIATSDDELVFDADQFSVYAVVYTVDFHHSADGERLEASLQGEDFAVSVTYRADAGIPEGAELVAREITAESDPADYAAYLSEAEQLINPANGFDLARFFDIAIVADGAEIEPQAPVSVNISYKNGMKVEDDSTLQVLHFADAGTEVLDPTTTQEDGLLTDVTFETESFSAYATISERIGSEMADKCIAYFSFDDETSGFAGAGARAQRTGTIEIRDGYSEHALYLNGNGSLNVTKSDGTSLLTGLDEFTVSYWAYPDANNNGNWSYYAAPDGNAPIGGNENYIGTLHNGGAVTAERYQNGRSPVVTTNETSLNEWHHVAVVYKSGSTEVYVDGKLAGSESSNVDLSNLLGGTSVFQIGKANWGGGEYFHGYLDEFAVFNSALSADDVAKLCDNAYFHDAKKVSVTDLREGQSVIIYNKVYNDETLSYDYYAIDGNGQLSPVYDISDTIYWRHDSSLEWKLIVYYRTQRDADGNVVYDEDGNPVYELDDNGQKIESGYYEFYNEATGKYLAPQAGSWSADAPFGVNLDGRKNKQYASTIESWDNATNHYYGYRYDDGQLTTAPNTADQEHRDWPFYFATTEILKEGELETVATVTNPSGLTIKMFDYPGTRWNTHPKDRTAYLQTILHDQGPYTHGAITQGILSDEFENGWPQITGGGSMSQLYSGGTVADGLFIKSIYDESGYYEYSSFNNYAYLGDSSTFTVYKQIGTPNNNTNNDRFYWKRGNFLPYNPIDSAHISNNSNYYHERSSNQNEKLSTEDPRYGETLYLAQPSQGGYEDQTQHGGSTDPKYYIDYYFGMSIDANFLMPAGGIDERENPITFEFNGDDDMWVYVDGVLVLDLGGIHDAREAKIDFENGTIYYANANENTRPTTIKGCFERAGVFPDGTPWDPTRVDEYFRGNTFKDYTTHTMKMFYMERGAGASNLHVKFNLPIVEPGKFSVEKHMEGSADAYANTYFVYKAYKVTDPNNPTNRTVIKPENGVTCVYEGTTNPVPFDAAGNFYLKPGEKASFSVGDQTMHYVVEEVGVASSVGGTISPLSPDEYDVAVNGEPVEIQSGTASSTMDTVRNRSNVIFKNKNKQLGSLLVTKKVERDVPDPSNPTFEFYVYLEDTAGNIVPYAYGDYYVKKGDKYYEYRDGQLVETADQSNPVHYKAGQYGAIANIPDGYSLEVKNLLPGTHFLVTERLDTIPENYYFLNKQVKAGTYEATNTSATYNGTAPDGRIKANTEAEVLVTNRVRGHIVVEKQWVSGDFVTQHGDVYGALYQIGTDANGKETLTLVEGSAKKFVYDSTTGRFLADYYVLGDISSYTIREVTVTLDGDGNVTAVTGLPSFAAA